MTISFVSNARVMALPAYLKVQPKGAAYRGPGHAACTQYTPCRNHRGLANRGDGTACVRALQQPEELTRSGLAGALTTLETSHRNRERVVVVRPVSTPPFTCHSPSGYG